MTPSEPLPTIESANPFDALADPHRRTIVEMLSHGEQAVRPLAEQLPISRPAVSRHLRVLKEAGLVADRPEGTRRLYRLDDAGIEHVRNYIDQVWGTALKRFAMLAENTAPGQPDRGA